MLYNPPTGGGSNDPYVGKNVAAGIQGSKIPPGAIEYTQREIVAAIAAAGLNPTNADLGQLAKAIQAIAAPLSSAGVTSYGASTTVALSNADVGRIVNLNGVVRNVTLPDVSTVPDGNILVLHNTTPGYDITLSAASGDQIFLGTGPVLSTKLAYTEDVVLFAFNFPDAPRWVALTGALHTRTTAQFSSSLGTAGYKRIADASSPTGSIIEQWGSTTITAANTPQTVTLPIAFPNAIMQATGTSASTGSYAGAAVATLNQITVFGSNPGAVVAWRAYGY